jgi:hypothetical protein
MKTGPVFAAATLLVALAACAHAQTCSLAQMASLDMTIGKQGLPMAPVTINGTSYSFMVDTAGVFSKISGSGSV